MTAPVDVLAVLDATILAAEADARMYKLDDAAKAVAVFKATRAAVAELIEAAKCVMGVADNAYFVSDVCCCGSRTDCHSHGDNHAPTDSGTYYGNIALDRLRATLAAVQGVQP